jgi:hypothetical protein
VIGARDTQVLVTQMAADLRRLKATSSERDAIRALLTCPYGWGQVVALVDLALFEAQQNAVSDTMANSR